MTKRRWFQIHLSTAIVMMFAASLLLLMNLACRECEWAVFEANTWQHYGFPYDALAVERSTNAWDISLLDIDRWYVLTNTPLFSIALSVPDLTCNVVVGIISVIISVCTCEFFARSRSIEKGRRTRQ